MNDVAETADFPYTATIMRTTLHLMSHTHWDREWFVPSGFAREWLLPFFESLFGLIESESEYRFVLDGQSILIEDYLAQLSAPARDRAASRIGRHVESGRLVIGPYYQQPDWQLVSGEALVRNLLIGSADSDALGGRSNAGWLMDNFGQISQCVQIHKGFGIRGLYAWRGFDLLPDRVKSEILWESPDGSRLPVIYLIDSYRNGMRLFNEPHFVSRRLAAAQARVQPFSRDDNLLLMNGYDQEMDPENVPAGIRDVVATANEAGSQRPARMVITTPDHYLEVKDAAFEASPEIVHGAQYSGRFISVFPGILSARSYLKIANSRAQTVLERYIEPLATILAGHAPDLAAPFLPELDLLWRLTLQNHPHDTICGVSSDPVHEETELRLAELEKRHLTVLRALTRDLGALLQKYNSVRTDTTADAPESALSLLFNPSLWPRHVVVQETDEVDRLIGPIEPLTVTLTEREGGDSAASIERVTVDTRQDQIRIGNGIVTCTVDSTGAVSIGRVDTGVVVDDCIRWRDGGDTGDTYNYDPPAQDRFVESLENVNIQITHHTSLRAAVRLEGSLRIPIALSETRTTRTLDATPVWISLSLEVRAGEAFIRGRVTVVNAVRDHRLQICLRVPGSSEVATLSQFSWDTPNGGDREHTGVREVPTNVRALMLGAREPRACMVFPSERAVAIGRESVGVVMAHRGLHEAELVDQDTVALTLVRSVGWLARGDLDSRSGDAGPEIFTPGAQCLREIATDIMVAPCASFADARGAQGNRVVEEFLCPVVRLSTDGLVPGDRASRSGRHLPTAMQLAVNPPIIPAVEAAGAILPSALKPSEDHRSVVLRVFNPGSAATIAVFPQEVQRVTLQESADEATALRALRWTIGAGEIATFRRELPQPLPTQATDWRDRFAAVLEGRLPYHRYGVVRGRLAPTAWDWLFGPAPSKGGDLGARFASKATTAERAYVKEVFGEERYRADRLRQEAKNAHEQSAVATAADRNMEHRRTIELRSTASTLHRQALEAELSVVFAEWDLARYHETVSSSDRDKLYEEIRRIALELNHSRVAKRTDDYLAALAHG